MSGISRKNGKRISKIEAIKESIEAILTTPVGSRVIHKEWGSRLFELIDAPINNSLDIYSEVAIVIDRFEPRVKLTKVSLIPADGAVTVEIYGVLKESGESFSMNVGVHGG